MANMVVEAVHSERYDNFLALGFASPLTVVEAVHSERYDNSNLSPLAEDRVL